MNDSLDDAVDQGLAALDEFAVRAREAEIGTMLSISSLIDSYRVHETGVVVVGTEQLVRPVSEVAVEVGEFLSCEIAVHLCMDEDEATGLVCSVISGGDRNPSLTKSLLSGGDPQAPDHPSLSGRGVPPRTPRRAPAGRGCGRTPRRHARIPQEG